MSAGPAPPVATAGWWPRPRRRLARGWIRLAGALWTLALLGGGRVQGQEVRLLETGSGHAVIEAVFPPQAPLAARVRAVLVGLPLDAEPRLEVLQAEAGAAAVVPGVDLAADPDVAGLAALAGPARLGPVGFIRGQRVVQVAFEPRAAPDGSFQVFDRTVVRLDFAGGSGSVAVPAAPDPWGERYLRGAVLNYEQARLWRRPGPAPAPRPAASMPSARVRLRVTDEGLYRVGCAELQAVGLPVTGVQSGQLRLYYGGGLPLPEESRGVVPQELPLIVEDGGDGLFDGSDYVLFYAEPASRWVYDAERAAYVFRNNPYTRANVYWLGVAAQPGGLRAPVLPSASVGPVADTVRTYRARLRQELDQYVSIQTSGISSGYEWYWEVLSGNARRYPVALWDAVSDTVQIVLGFQVPGAQRAVLEVSWNDRLVRSVSVPGLGSSRTLVQSTVATREGTNHLGLVHTGGASARLDYFEIDYCRRLAARGGALLFDARPGPGAAEFVVAGSGGQSVRVFEVSQGLREILPLEAAAATDTVRFRDEAASVPRRYLVTTAEHWLRPAAMELDAGDELRAPAQGAEYVIIAHRDFLASAHRLAAWRAADDRFGKPLTTRVVDVQHVYDEFSGGMLDPTAIRAFLRHASETWSPPPFFVLLLGDGTYDYKNNSGASPGVWIPAYQHGESTYDEWYVCVSGDDVLPDMAIGRLPVQTAADAAFVVDRLIAYDRQPPYGPWQSRVLVVADDLNNPQKRQIIEPYFLTDADYLSRRYLPQDLDLRKLYLAQFPLEGQTKPRARAEFLRQFNDGVLLALFVGHGNADVLAHEHVFVVSRDLDEIRNGARLPLFYTAACQVGAFDDPLKASMPEALLLRRGGGVIGMVCATRVGFHASNMRLANRFHEQLLRAPERYVPVGLALMAAKHLVQEPLPGHDQTGIRCHSLFGDPAQRLALPQRRVVLTAPDTLHALAEVRVDGQVVDAEGAVLADYEGQAWVQAFDSAEMSQLDGYPYLQLGVPLLRGTYPVRQGRFSAVFRVPKDITYRGADGRMNAYVWDETTPSGYGSVRGLVLAGTATEAGDDRAGPEIHLAFAGQPRFVSGGTIAPDAVLCATIADPSGINVTGETGHEIELAIDGQTRAITEAFSVHGDYRTGTLTHALEALAPGPHTIGLKAWDTYNNSAVAAVTVQVSGRAEMVLTELLFHPNPLRAAAGHFTYNLALPVRQARIRIFALSGRLVDELVGDAAIGYNQVAWEPPAELANGAYPYYIEAVREDGSRLQRTGVLQLLR